MDVNDVPADYWADLEAELRRITGPTRWTNLDTAIRLICEDDTPR